MKKYLFLLIILSGIFWTCSSGEGNIIDDNRPDIPTNVEDTTKDDSNKSIQLWIDANANFTRFATQSNIKLYLEKINTAGFNEIYLDVKPGIGYALYDSDILPKMTKLRGETIERDWDYLGYWIEEAEKYGISVIASISTMGYGDIASKEGLIYDSNTWDNKTQMEMVDSNPDNIVDMKNQTGVDAAMLNPCHPEVQSFVISIIEEIVTKYPKLKGICLDYCRWYGANYGFGDATIAAFEAYSGEKLSNKNDIITATGGIGSRYKEWIEFRSMTVTNLITNIRSKIESIDADMELHLWASADWNSRFSVGQNWASKNYVPSGIRYSNNYSKTGFADQLDVFSLGAYAEYVWTSENPGSVWSVQNFVSTYSDYTMGDCKVCGSIASYAYGNNESKISDAIYLCLKNTDGVMVFDISHVINFNQWNTIEKAIKRVVQ